jgi:hypothetical protein
VDDLQEYDESHFPGTDGREAPLSSGVPCPGCSSMQRCKEARSHQQRARTDRPHLDVVFHFRTDTLTLPYQSLSRSSDQRQTPSSAGSECLSPDHSLPSRSSVRVSSSRNRLPANSCTPPPSWHLNATYPNLPYRLDTSIGRGQVPASQKTAACKPDLGGASGCTAAAPPHCTQCSQCVSR